MVNNDTDTPRLLPSNAGLLELQEGESTTLTDFAVVANGLATDSGAEEVEGAHAEGGSLGLAGVASAELASGLVEPGADTALPVLPEVVGVEDCRLKLRKNVPAEVQNEMLTVVVGETHVLVYRQRWK